jgi:hypothetical protein
MMLFIRFYAPGSIMMLRTAKISRWNFNGLDKVVTLDALLCTRITSCSNTQYIGMSHKWTSGLMSGADSERTNFETLYTWKTPCSSLV